MLIALKMHNFTLEFTFLKVDNKTLVLILKSVLAAITRFLTLSTTHRVT